MLTTARSTDEAHEHRRPLVSVGSTLDRPCALDPGKVVQRGLYRVLSADDLELRAQRRLHNLSVAQCYLVLQRLVWAAQCGGVAAAISWLSWAGLLVDAAVLVHQVIRDALAAADVPEVASKVKNASCECTYSMSPGSLRPAADNPLKG